MGEIELGIVKEVSEFTVTVETKCLRFILYRVYDVANWVEGAEISVVLTDLLFDEYCLSEILFPGFYVHSFAEKK